MPNTAAAGLDPDRPDASPMDVESDDVCWICLDEKKLCQDLLSPCKCPRKVHPRCMARWQLQQAGRAEETHCRFCNSTLADWKASLTPDALKPEVEKVQPIMVVYFEGEIHRIPVRQGDEGLKEFTSRIRELFKLPPEVDISLTFGCKEPMSGHHLKLEGMGAFDAAVHCASVAAAERQHKAGQRITNGRLEEGAESSDEGEDTTDLLQSTLGGPIQRPPGNRAGALAAAIPPMPVPVTNPGPPANRPRFSPAAAPLDSPRGPHTPRGPSTPTNTTPTRLPSTRTSSQRQHTQAASPLQHTNDNAQTRYQYPPRTPPAADWRTTMVADPAPNGMRRMNALPPSDMGHGPDTVNARNTVQERIRELERLASRIPRSSGSTRSPIVSTGGNNAPAQTFSQAAVNNGDDLSTQRRVRRTSSRNQRAAAEPINHQGIDSTGGSDPMDVDDAPVAVGTLETAGGPGASAGSLGPSTGKRQGGPGQINYDVPPNAISRSKLNSVLSFFGIRPPVQYTLGSTVTMDE